jgi:hypothetical protein
MDEDAIRKVHPHTGVVTEELKKTCSRNTVHLGITLCHHRGPMWFAFQQEIHVAHELKQIVRNKQERRSEQAQ